VNKEWTHGYVQAYVHDRDRSRREVLLREIAALKVMPIWGMVPNTPNVDIVLHAYGDPTLVQTDRPVTIVSMSVENEANTFVETSCHHFQ